MKWFAILLLAGMTIFVTGCSVDVASRSAEIGPAGDDHEDVASVAGGVQVDVMILGEQRRLSVPVVATLSVPPILKDALITCIDEQQKSVEMLGEVEHGQEDPLSEFVQCTMETLRDNWINPHSGDEVI